MTLFGALLSRRLPGDPIDLHQAARTRRPATVIDTPTQRGHRLFPGADDVVAASFFVTRFRWAGLRTARRGLSFTPLVEVYFLAVSCMYRRSVSGSTKVTFTGRGRECSFKAWASRKAPVRLRIFFVRAVVLAEPFATRTQYTSKCDIRAV